MWYSGADGVYPRSHRGSSGNEQKQTPTNGNVRLCIVREDATENMHIENHIELRHSEFWYTEKFVIKYDVFW